MASDITEQDQLLLVNALLPQETGQIFKQKVTYSCLDVRGSTMALGSEQGHSWLVDMPARKLIREHSDGKAPIKVIRLHSEHTLFASGSEDGLLAVVNYSKPSMKQITKERDEHSVTAMEWSEEENHLFVGYSSGKILTFTIRFDKVLSVENKLLYECGAEIIQLIHNEHMLLVSTITKPFLLDTKTIQVAQVGSRERKPGAYGGTFTNLSRSLIIARPGLRLWIADSSGKVQSTAKFKEVLFNTSPSPPPMSLFGGITTLTTPTDTWQFGKLVSWSDEWVVCFHGNTAWVLEPCSLSCKGVISLGQKVIDVITCKNDLYLLLHGHQRLVVKLSLPKQDVPLPARVEMGGDLSPLGSFETNTETIKDDVMCGVPVTDEQTLDESNAVTEEVGHVTRDNEYSSKESDHVTDHVTTDEALIGATSRELGVSTNNNSKQDDDNVASDERTYHDTPTQQDLLATVLEQEKVELTPTDSSHSINRETASVPILTKTAEEEGEGDEQTGSRKMLDVVGTGFTDLKGLLAQPLSKLTVMKKQPEINVTQEEEKEEPVITSVPLSSNEVSRRVKMLQVDDDDDVVVHKKSRRIKKKPTRRKNRITPASSTHSSMDRLDEIANDDVVDSASATPTLDHKQQQELTDQNEDTSSISCQSSSTQIECIETSPNVEEVTVTHKSKDDDGLFDREEIALQKSSETDIDQQEQPPLVSINAEDVSVAVETAQPLQTQVEELENSLLLNATPPVSLIATPPVGTRGRARAFNMDSDDVLFGPSSPEELLPWEKPDSLDPLLLPVATTKEPSPRPSDSSFEIIVRQLTPDGGGGGGRDSQSHSVSSSYSAEDTLAHPLASDSDTEDDPLQKKINPHDSIVAADFYTLVGQLVGDTRQTESDMPLEQPSLNRHRADAILPVTTQTAVTVDKEDDISDVHAADVWCPLPQPSQGTVQCICMSRNSIWLIDQRRTVYWSSPATSGCNWQAMKKHMNLISSSSNGLIVWGVYNQQAYFRYGISDICSCGTEWKKAARKSSMVSKHIKWIACDNSTVWAITTDGKILHRKGVTSGQPEGLVWTEVTPSSHQIVQITCCNNIVWGLDQNGNAFVRESVTSTNPMGRNWKRIKSPHFSAISVTDAGVVWGIGTSNKLWFRVGASAFEPEGAGPWWEVSVSTLGKSQSHVGESLWKVMSFERSASFLQSVSSLLSSSQQRLVAISACFHSGVCLLTSDNQLHACWGTASGYHYDRACEDEVFNMSMWTQVTSGNLGTWVVREDGELYCITSPNRLERVECQGVIEVLASSPSAVWVLSKGQIWSRQGITALSPQGFSWEYIELGSHMQEFIVHLAIGTNVAWAVDKSGRVHFRFGIHPREPGTGMSPAWIEVLDPGKEYSFQSIGISSDDWLVWAVDNENTVYVRKEVTSDYPVGRSWERVGGEQVRKIAVSQSRVFAISVAGGELLCRQGITRENPVGTYWRRLPGNFDTISSNSSGELWVVDGRGAVKKQRGKAVSVRPAMKRREDELETGVVVEDWEVL